MLLAPSCSCSCCPSSPENLSSPCWHSFSWVQDSWQARYVIVPLPDDIIVPLLPGEQVQTSSRPHPTSSSASRTVATSSRQVDEGTSAHNLHSYCFQHVVGMNEKAKNGSEERNSCFKTKGAIPRGNTNKKLLLEATAHLINCGRGAAPAARSAAASAAPQAEQITQFLIRL